MEPFTMTTCGVNNRRTKKALEELGKKAARILAQSAKCGCCRQPVSVIGSARLARALFPPKFNCMCQEAPRCLSCGRCPEHHRCGNTFYAG